MSAFTCSILTWLPPANLWQAFNDSNVMGRSIVLLQILLSIVVWSIMVGKRRELAEMEALARRFRQIFDGTGATLDIYLQRHKSDNPIVLVYRAACERLVKCFPPEERNPLLAREPLTSQPRLDARSLNLVKGTTEQALSEQVMRIERGMNWLATGATVAPLIGLLGTVWGVMQAFQSMGRTGSALLTDVAPGISAALLTTVVGLLVAIPSGCGYNLLLGRIRRLTGVLDGFTDELLGRVCCEYQRRED